MTCKDCLSELSCASMLKEMYQDKTEECPYIKNKADFVEVKHGEWIDNIKVISTVGMADIKALVGYRCSVCGREEVAKEPYCNCGAKMDGGKAE